MTINEAITVLEDTISFKNVVLVNDAWQTVKAHYTQPTAHNISVMPCGTINCYHCKSFVCDFYNNCAGRSSTAQH